MAPQYADSYLYRAKKYLMYTFTGIVVVGTLYNIFISQPPTFDEHDKRKKKKDTTKKKEKEVQLKEARTINEWTRVELFQFLAKNKIYPDVDTPVQELREQVSKLQKEIDSKNTEEIVLEASL